MSRLLDFCSPKMHQNQNVRGFALNPTGGGYSALPNPPAGSEGACCPFPKNRTPRYLPLPGLASIGPLGLASQTPKH